METLASKTMLKTCYRSGIFKGLEIEKLDRSKRGGVFPMVIWPEFRMGEYRANDHPYHAPQFIDLFEIANDKNGTYSEAMLISGASKQISSAILYYFRFYNLLKILSSRHHYIPGDEPKNWLRFIIHNGCITDVIAVISDYLFLFQFLLLWHIHNSGYNQGKRRCCKNEPVSLKTTADVTD